MLNALQLFAQYLHETENWSYRLIQSLPDVKNTIASKYFLKCNYYDPLFRYIEFPLRTMEQPRRGMIDRLCNWLLSRSLGWYPNYLEYYLNDIDIMHSHFAYVGWEYRHLFKKKDIPHVVSFYGADYRLQGLGLRDPREYFNGFDLFLCEGRYGASQLIEMGCPERKVSVQHLGVEVSDIKFEKRVKVPNQLNLLQIATFREKKGQAYTLEAFLKALPACPNMTLTFVGGDPEGLRQPLQEIARSHAGEKVRFLDSIPFDHLHAFLGDYQVFIHPSIYSRDGNCEGGAPVVLLDAQATGMPVIATTHCDISEEVLNEHTGLLTREKDVEALTDRISRFYRMSQYIYWQMSENARKHVEAEYDCKKCGRQLYDKYAGLTGIINK